MILGLTGCSGSGSTTVAGVWREMGASVCSLDRVGHGFLGKGSVKKELEEVLSIPGLSSMTVNAIRSQLRNRAFTEPRLLQLINGVLHKRLQRWTAASAELLRGKRGIFVLDAALIFELELDAKMDFTVTVKDRRNRCVERLAERDGLSTETASGRWDSQIDMNVKCLRSNFVIDNSGSLLQLKNNAKNFYINVIQQMEDV